MEHVVRFSPEFFINKNVPVPYYHQLFTYILGEIESGRWMPQQKLPSEAEFCEHLDISRTVVRQAIKELQNKGYLSTEKGKGTFIAKPKIIEGFVQALAGFQEDMERRGFQVTTRILKQEVVPATRRVAEKLNVEIGTPTIMLSRLRELNGEPSVYVTTYIPQSLCPQLLHADMENRSLYAFLREMCGSEMRSGRRYIGVSLANDYEASLLGIDMGAPLIELDSVSYRADGRVLEYFHALHRGDRTRFEVNLVRLTSSDRSAESE